MAWLNEQEDLVLRKTDIYAWAMRFRPSGTACPADLTTNSKYLKGAPMYNPEIKPSWADHWPIVAVVVLISIYAGVWFT